MGFVYNNHWEAVCKSYLEMNGCFVMSNVFVALFIPGQVEHEGEQDVVQAGGNQFSPRLEADLIAYKPASANLTQYGVPLDTAGFWNRNPGQHEDEFFAGTEGVNRLVYCEIKAYLRSAADGFAEHFAPEPNINSKIQLIRDRFGMDPEVVLIGHGVTNASKASIHQRGWKYKELGDVFRFIAERFRLCDEKLQAVYNDPCLEMMRGLATFGLPPGLLPV
jgi:hypothetical protein